MSNVKNTYIPDIGGLLLDNKYVTATDIGEVTRLIRNYQIYKTHNSDDTPLFSLYLGGSSDLLNITEAVYNVGTYTSYGDFTYITPDGIIWQDIDSILQIRINLIIPDLPMTDKHSLVIRCTDVGNKEFGDNIDTIIPLDNFNIGDNYIYTEFVLQRYKGETITPIQLFIKGEDNPINGTDIIDVMGVQLEVSQVTTQSIYAEEPEEPIKGIYNQTVDYVFNDPFIVEQKYNPSLLKVCYKHAVKSESSGNYDFIKNEFIEPKSVDSLINVSTTIFGEFDKETSIAGDLKFSYNFLRDYRNKRNTYCKKFKEKDLSWDTSETFGLLAKNDNKFDISLEHNHNKALKINRVRFVITQYR